MDDTMSSYSFSHQFYQRWTCAPEPIRAAITQELKDITTLLQSDTPFESFVFHTHDLDTHVDELYENHEAEQAIAKAITDKKAQDKAAAEKQRLEEEQKRQAEEDAKRKEEAELEEAKLLAEAETAQKELEKNKQLATEKDNRDETEAATDKINADSDTINSTEENNSTEANASEHTAAKNQVTDDKSSDNKRISDDNAVNDKPIKNDNSIKAIHDKASAAITLALKDTKLSASHQELIHELEMQIDDYLSEQMMLMSENLKSWLRAEVTQHLGEQDTSLTDKNGAKKNSH